MKKNVYILGLCRTAIGSFGGSFKNTPAVLLGSTVIKDAILRAGISPSDIDEVIMGNVLTAGLGQNPARQAAISAGIPKEVPAVTVNKVCGSGLYAVALAYRSILAEEGECLVVGGMESMTNAPYVLPNARWGARMNNATMIDSMVNDGLFDAFNKYHMGITAENVAEQFHVTREMQDEFAALSQQKAAHARKEGWFKEEITPVSIPQKKGEPIVVDTDEYIREQVTAESISKLKPVFKENGTVTAANASGINDCASAMVVCSEEFLKKHNLKPMLKIVSSASCGVDPSIMGIGPVPSIKKALKKANLTVEDIDLFELNEAFAAQSVAVANELSIPIDKINVNGGAISLGHPIGASGARILVTLAYALKKNACRYGAASLCIGGGMGEAMIVELV